MQVATIATGALRAFLRLAAYLALLLPESAWVAEAVPPLRDLGAKLFADKRLSADGTVSCASCHEPKLAFSDGRPASVGIRGLQGTRNAPSLLNVGDHSTFFWDGRRNRLEDQVLDPLMNGREHGFKNADELLARLSEIPAYSGLDLGNLAGALSDYVRSLGGRESRFDRFWAGQKSALSEAERYGLEIFRGTGQCASCHLAVGERPAFTDDKFHSLGVGQERLNRDLSEVTRRALAMKPSDREAALGGDVTLAALGRFNVTLKPTDIGKYRTPSLRNVAVTAPYMHDGSVATLEEAVDRELYYRSASMGRPLILTPAERASLVAFLRTLTSDSIQSSASR